MPSSNPLLCTNNINSSVCTGHYNDQCASHTQPYGLCTTHDATEDTATSRECPVHVEKITCNSHTSAGCESHYKEVCAHSGTSTECFTHENSEACARCTRGSETCTDENGYRTPCPNNVYPYDTARIINNTDTIITASQIDELINAINREADRRKNLSEHLDSIGETVRTYPYRNVPESTRVNSGQYLKGSVNNLINTLRDAISAMDSRITFTEDNNRNRLRAASVNEIKEKLESLETQCLCDCNFCACNCDFCTCQCDYACTCNCNYTCTCDCDYDCTCNCNYDCTCQCYYTCTCNCNYVCTCQCNYACTCQCNYSCTCRCNYCTCNCNYDCTCDCNYS